MGNNPSVNCGCFDSDTDRLKESNCFDARNKPIKRNDSKLLDNNQKLYTPATNDVHGGTGMQATQSTIGVVKDIKKHSYIKVSGPPGQRSKVQSVENKFTQGLNQTKDNAKTPRNVSQQIQDLTSQQRNLRNSTHSISNMSEIGKSLQKIALDNPSLKRNQMPSIYDYKKFKFMKDISTRYSLGKVLGQGAFGLVRYCTHKASGKEFAIKIMQKKQIEKQKIYVQLLQNELSILGSKSHPNIIRIVDLMEDDDNYYVVSEVVRGGELFKRLTKLESFSEAQAADITHQIMLGLNYLHKQNITHRDIKPENILLVDENIDNFEIKIADLGFAQEFDKETGLDLVLGTPLYMAPELVLNKKYSEKVDVWSLGVITYQLLSGRTPFDASKIKKINYNIIHKEIKFPEKQWAGISEHAKNFIMLCLDRNQNTRPSIAELFDHPWISEQQPEENNDQEVRLNIQKNIVAYNQLTNFQKIVLSLVSGLTTTQEELQELQKAFIKLDVDKKGTIGKQELLGLGGQKQYDVDWDAIVSDIGEGGGTGVIDFQQFMSACVNRKKLKNKEDVKVAFKILDADQDGKISLQDLDDIFCSYGGAKMTSTIWQQLLSEADRNHDGVVSENEFTQAIGSIIQKSMIQLPNSKK